MSLDFGGDSDSARILIADHGDGVPPEALGRIFEPFYRVTEAREMCIRDRHLTTPNRGLGSCLRTRRQRVNE